MRMDCSSSPRGRTYQSPSDRSAQCDVLLGFHQRSRLALISAGEYRGTPGAAQGLLHQAAIAAVGPSVCMNKSDPSPRPPFLAATKLIGSDIPAQYRAAMN